MFESLQHTVAEDSEKYGKALPEIEKQLENIQSEFSQFVTLNSSGDPVEVAAILDETENHILALTHIADRIPALVETLTKELPDQLADLEEGYRKLLDANYHFTETDIESRFQLLHESLKIIKKIFVSWNWTMQSMKIIASKKKSMRFMISSLVKLQLKKSS